MIHTRIFFLYNVHSLHFGYFAPYARAREALRRRARANDRSKKLRPCRRLNNSGASPVSHSAGEARTKPCAPEYGHPVPVVRATVPSQMPLRGPQSHSETISAPGQYETLESPSKALRLAYSASGPPHRHTARRSTTGHTMRSSRTALHPRCRHEPRGCDLNSVNETEITQREVDFRGEGNRLLPVTGRGEGVRPRARPRAPRAPRPFRGKSTLWSCQRTLLRPCRAPTAGPPFYR